jgi:hypothetical protein
MRWKSDSERGYPGARVALAIGKFGSGAGWDGLCAGEALLNCDCPRSFTLSGTIGQADAGVMSGGGFVLAGGIRGGGEISCPWDCADDDGIVGIIDFLALLAQWGEVGSSCDFDGDGVDRVDLFQQLLANWGPCPG